MCCSIPAHLTPLSVHSRPPVVDETTAKKYTASNLWRLAELRLGLLLMGAHFHPLPCGIADGSTSSLWIARSSVNQPIADFDALAGDITGVAPGLYMPVGPLISGGVNGICNRGHGAVPIWGGSSNSQQSCFVDMTFRRSSVLSQHSSRTVRAMHRKVAKSVASL